MSYDNLYQKNVELIEEAYARLAIIPDELTPLQINQASKSINLILCSWMNKGLNLWTVKTGVISPIFGQSSYILPTYCSKVLSVNLRNTNRQLGGTPTSTSSNPEYAFDGNLATSCSLLYANDFIGYSWGSNVLIDTVGICLNHDAELSFKLSAPSLIGSSLPASNFSITLPSTNFKGGHIQWFDITPGTYQQQLQIQLEQTQLSPVLVNELYFCSTSNEIPLAAISRQNYTNLYNKNLMGQITTYYFDRQISPILNIWQTPSSELTPLIYVYEQRMPDANGMLSTADISPSFWDALCAELAFRLSLKTREISPDLIQLLKMEAKESFEIAAGTDTESVPLKLNLNWKK